MTATVAVARHRLGGSAAGVAVILVSLAVGAAVALGDGVAVAFLIAAALAAAIFLRTPETATRGLLPLALLAPPTIAVHLSKLPDQTVLRACVVISTCAIVAATVVRRHETKLVPRLPRHLLVLAGLYCGLIAILASSQLSVPAVRAAIALTVGAAAPGILVYACVRSPHQIRRFAVALVVVGAAASAIAVLEEIRRRYFVSAQPGVFFHPDARGGLLRVQGIFPHPIVLGTVIGMTLPVALALARSEDRRLRLTGWGAAAIQLIALLLTLSRGPWIATSLAVAAALLLWGKRGVPVALAAAAAVAVVLTLPTAAPVRESASALVHPTTAEQSYVIAYRRELLSQVWSYARSHPLRATLDPSSRPALGGSVAGRAVDITESVDNAFLYYILQTSLVGAILLFGFLGCTTVSIARSARRLAGEARLLQGAIAGGLAGLLVVSATVATISWEQVGVLASMLIGLAFAQIDSARRSG